MGPHCPKQGTDDALKPEASWCVTWLLCRSSVPTLGVNGSDRQLHLTQLALRTKNLRISEQYRAKINNVLPRAHHLSIHMSICLFALAWFCELMSRRTFGCWALSCPLSSPDFRKASCAHPAVYFT